MAKSTNPTGSSIMSLAHPRWREFQHRLALVVVIFCDPDPDDWAVEFHCDHDHKHTRHILAAMGFTTAAIEATLACWAHGTTFCCDCAALAETLDEIPERRLEHEVTAI